MSLPCVCAQSKALEADLQSVNSHIDTLDGHLDSLFTRSYSSLRGLALQSLLLVDRSLTSSLRCRCFSVCSIFVHRFRDIDPAIRALCIEKLGEWLVALPDKWLDDKRLKYLGWTLNDKVRTHTREHRVLSL